ncbi:MAG: hypothetical protein IPL89_11175 [Acidobacteria bacterium]|nr:hypothetical protein [Acidobacteriota bacterium]
MVDVGALAAPAELNGGAVSDLGELRALGCDLSWMAPPAGSVLAYGESSWIASPSVSNGWGFIPLRALTGRASTARAARCGGDWLYTATDRGLESASLRSGSSRRFSSSFAHYATGASAVLPLADGTVLVGLTQTPSTGGASPVLRCDPATGRCDAAASGIVVFGADRALLLMTAADGSILLVMRASGAWRSTDGGRTFSLSSTGLPSNQVSSAADVDGHPAVVVFGAVWRSTNSGASWSIARAGSTPADLPPTTLGAVGGGNGVLLAGVNGSTTSNPAIYRSTNGGASWTGPHAGIGGRTLNRLLATPEGTWAATNAGVFFSGDGGVTWQGRNAGLTNLTVPGMAACGGSILAATPGEASGLYRSTNGGATWTTAGPSFANQNIGVLAATGSLAFAGGASQSLNYSTDCGATWIGAYNLPGNTFPLTLTAADGYFYAANLLGTSLYRTSDMFLGWQAVSPPVPFAARTLAVSGSNIVLASGSVLYRSIGGAHYVAGGALFPGGLWEVSKVAFTGSTLWAAVGGASGTQYGLFRSTDVGATWARSQTGIPNDEPVYDISASGSRLYAGTRAGPYVSDDGGATWTLVSESARGLAVRSILASGGTLHLGTAGESVLSLPTIGATRRLVPVVLDVDTGTTRYTTDMSVTNRGTSDTQVTMTYTPSLGSGGGSVSVPVRARTQFDVPDVIGYLRQNGVPVATDGQQAGTLLLSFTDVSDPEAVGVLARTAAATTAPQPAGRAGLAYAAIDPDAASAGTLRVYALRESATDRSNVAVYNTSSQPVTVEVKAVSGDGSGASAIVAAADVLPAWGWKQYNRVLNTAGMTNGWVEVKRTSAAGSFSAYGVINDNGTNDGSFVTPNAVEPRPLFMNVPVLVETGAFLSELVLTNGSTKPGDFVLTYVEALETPGPGNQSILITLPPKTQRIIPNAIDWLRSHNIAVGAAGGADAGALNVFVSSGAAVGEIFAGSRTAAPSPAGGQFGLFSSAALAGDEAAATAFLYGLRADANNRSNVAAVNTGYGAQAGPITLLFEIFDGAGGGVRASQSMTLDPGEWGQLSGPLAQAGVSSGWVKVSRTAGSAPWIAYGVVNDGGQPGQRTGDGAYVPMAR